MERKRARITSSDEEQVIAMRNDGKTFREISETLHIAVSTCSLIVRTGANGKRVPKKAGRKKLFLPDPHGVFVGHELDEDCRLTLTELADRCKEQFGLVFSRSTISRSITDFHYSFQRSEPKPETSETPESIREREVFAAQFAKQFRENPTSFFFMDEIKFSVSMRRPYGDLPHSNPAAPPIIRTMLIRVLALAGTPQGKPPEKVLVLEVLPGLPNDVRWDMFLVKALRALRARGIYNGTIVLEDVPSHRSKQVSELFPVGAPFSLMFMPPNSSIFSPINYGFDVWKDIVRNAKAKTEEELRNVIASAAFKITTDDIEQCIEHVKQNCELYASGKHEIT